MADLHLPIRPRSDLALINGLIHIVIEHDLVDREYIDAHTTGFDALRESVRDYTPERVAEITGLDARADLPHGVALRAAREPAFIGWTMGVNHSTKGTETVNAINNLALITGNIGRAGAAPFSITGQCNAMGTREAGFASMHARLPQVRERRRIAQELAALWNVPVERIPTRARPGLSRHHRSGARRQDPRALDHRHQPDRLVPEPRRRCSRRSKGSTSSSCRTAITRRRPPSSRDLVLPAAIWGEKEGTYTNSERRVSKVNRAVDAAGRSALRLRHLPRRSPTRSACATSCSRAGRTPGDAFEEWKRVSAGRLCDYSGMTYEAHRAARRHPVAVSRRRDRRRRRRAGSTPTAASRPTTAGRG